MPFSQFNLNNLLMIGNHVIFTASTAENCGLLTVAI